MLAERLVVSMSFSEEPEKIWTSSCNAQESVDETFTFLGWSWGQAGEERLERDWGNYGGGKTGRQLVRERTLDTSKVEPIGSVSESMDQRDGSHLRRSVLHLVEYTYLGKKWNQCKCTTPSQGRDFHYTGETLSFLLRTPALAPWPASPNSCP